MSQEDLNSLTVRESVRLLKFDGDYVEGKEPVEVIEREEEYKLGDLVGTPRYDTVKAAVEQIINAG